MGQRSSLLLLEMSLKIKAGEIWWATVAYDDDPSIHKDRPVLVMSSNEESTFALSLYITSKEKKRASDYVMQYWAESGLTKPSVIRTHRRLELYRTSFISKIGMIHGNDDLCLKLLIQQNL